MIEIDKDWRVTADEHNIILQKRIHTKTGREYWHDELFYGDIEGLLHGFVEVGIKQTKFKDFQTLDKKIKELHASIDKFFKGYSPKKVK